MNILELFAGTASFSRVAEFYGHDTYTIDNDPIFKTDKVMDIMDLTADNIPRPTLDGIPLDIDILWASPPCTSFSQSGVWKHWDYFAPKTDFAVQSLELIRKTIELIDELEPRYWFIENPRSILRKFPEMKELPIRVEVCYCRYGEFRMKPTDIWTNLETWEPRPFCYNGCRDHITAERGSTTGSQGMGKAESARVPQLLCLEILDAVKIDMEAENDKV